jgi:nucleoside-diphosphate-sugar epimerase
MRAAVTGAAGFVGAALVRRLLAHGNEVVAVVRPGTRPDRLAGVVDDVEVVEADFGAPAEAAGLVAAARPDVCLHLAAAGAVVRDHDPRRVAVVNALAPFELALALSQSGCRRLVTAGSSSEYGSLDGAMSEDRAPLPDDVYGAAKLGGGLLARAAGAAAGLETCHVRLFSVYGPGEDERRLVPSVARALLEGRPIELTPGEQVRDFVYVDDVAAALEAAAVEPRAAGEVVNAGTGRQTRVRELCLLLAAAAGAETDLLRFGVRPYVEGERFSWRAGVEHAAEVLGWRASTQLEDGLRLTLAALVAEPVAA